jgi:hypothetical protein
LVRVRVRIRVRIRVTPLTLMRSRGELIMRARDDSWAAGTNEIYR